MELIIVQWLENLCILLSNHWTPELVRFMICGMNVIPLCHDRRREGPVLCVSLSPALQKTMIVPRFAPGRVNRASRVEFSQGGKACNSARVLKVLGREAVLIGFNGGVTGAQVDDVFRQIGVETALVTVPQPTRTCTTVLDPETGTTTELVEEAPWPGAEPVASLYDLLRQHAPRASAAILAGALPPGSPATTYSDIISILHEHGVPVFIDTSGEAFRRSRCLKPLFMKLNRHEQQSTGPASVDDFARETLAAGVPWLLVTDGKHPATLYGPDGAMLFTPSEVAEVSALGCGDATTSGIVDAWLRGEPMPRAIAFGMACGAANAQTLIPGDFDKAMIREET
jgi:1-phosphofructokinase family hexose kinase